MLRKTELEKHKNATYTAHCSAPKEAHDLLQALLPQDARIIYNFHKALLRHAQRICVYNRPRCEKCPITDLCDYYKTVVKPQ